MPGQTLALETGELPDGRLCVSGAVDGKHTFHALAELCAL
jgi:hypothetical protein